MSHHCEAALLTCEDFRLHQTKNSHSCIEKFIESLNVVYCDMVTRGGGVQDLVRPKEAGFRDSIIRDLGVSVNLHKVKAIYLVNHEDCGAYSAMKFSSKEEEISQHKNDLLAAKEIVKKEFPGVSVKMFFARLEEGSGDCFYVENELEASPLTK